MKLINYTKTEIVRMSLKKCKHGHTGLSHPSCYFKESGTEETWGFLDIESSNLKANFGIVLTYCIKHKDGIIKRSVTPKDLKNGKLDRNVLKHIASDLRKFDRIFTFFGARFDIPFLRTRCMHYGIDFPTFQELHHTDVYEAVKRKVNLHSKRLQVCCDFFDIESKGHPITPQVWMSAMTGNQKALDYIMVHNIEDVIATEKLWFKIMPFTRMTKTSI